MKGFGIGLIVLGLGFAICAGLIAGTVTLWQPFRIYIAEYTVEREGLRGEAELKRAEQNRQIKIQEAQAMKDSAVFLADAEVARARGVAEANMIIADGLGGAEGYLRYLWIQTLDEKNNRVIYVPTEANIPIMEAGRTLQ